ncbi:MAG: stage II sporulation protein M [Nanoarchaeota archaeon]
MLETFLLDAEKQNKFLKISITTIFITFILGIVNHYFLNGISFFLITLVSLSLSYPVVRYILDIDRGEIDKLKNHKFTFQRYERELVVLWSIFCGAVVGFYLLNFFGFTIDFRYEESFISAIKGNFLENQLSFFQILSNNLLVALVTFLISTMVFSGLIFILLWNASILAFYLSSLGSHRNAVIGGVNILSYGLIEVGGFILAGMAGGILAYRLHKGFKSRYYKHRLEDGTFEKRRDRRRTFEKLVNKQLFIDTLVLTFASVIFIVIAAFIETML